MLGKQIANYRIEEKLGEGGMGVVYRAIDLDLDRPVAIKVLSADFSRDPALLERFRAEAKAQAHLNHTNIASLYTLLNVEDHLSIVMEYLEGETLDQMIQRRGLIPWEEAVPWFRQALLGIGFAHRRGIIHRDIKPSNIMVNRYGTVKVMDFGIAKVIGGQRLTRTGTNVGTVAYMSPEQVRNQPVDVRSDIYCLGVTLYELLTAHLPFESDSEFQVMSDHVNTPPPLPSRHYPYIPHGIEQAILRALAKEPAARFQSVEEFGAALEHPEGAAALPTTVLHPSTESSASSPSGAAIAGSSPTSDRASSRSSGEAPPIAPDANQPSASPPGSFRWNDRRILLGAGGVLLVLLVALGVALRPKPITPVPANLGGGGEISAVGAPGSQPNGGRDAQKSSAQRTSTVATRDVSSPQLPTIVDALKAEKNAGTASGSSLLNSKKLSARAPARTPQPKQQNPVAQSQAAPAPDRQSPTSASSSTASVTSQPAGPSEAELDSANDDLIKIRARMDAVHQSLANLKQQQAAEGLGLRGDIAASESRLYSYYQTAESALQQRNLPSAQKYTGLAEQELTKLEHFLGR